MEEQRSDKKFIYGLGSPDPRDIVSTGAVDMKITFILKDGKREIIPEIQRIRVHREPDGKAYGILETIFFDQDVVEQYRDTLASIRLDAISPTRKFAWCELYDIELGDATWDINIEDIFINVVYSFSAKESTPWKKYS